MKQMSRRVPKREIPDHRTVVVRQDGVTAAGLAKYLEFYRRTITGDLKALVTIKNSEYPVLAISCATVADAIEISKRYRAVLYNAQKVGNVDPESKFVTRTDPQTADLYMWFE